LAIIQKVHNTPEAQQKARLQYAAFKAREGAFARAAAKQDAKVMPAHQWWVVYGAGAPELQRVAVRVLSQVASACACERNWFTYDFIHNKKRNRLTPTRARDLVYVFTNGRLVDKLEGGTSEPFVGWDECSESGSESGSEGP
jgi:hypothetical protein